jgi:hypothetical protein
MGKGKRLASPSQVALCGMQFCLVVKEAQARWTERTRTIEGSLRLTVAPKSQVDVGQPCRNISRAGVKASGPL